MSPDSENQFVRQALKRGGGQRRLRHQLKWEIPAEVNASKSKSKGKRSTTAALDGKNATWPRARHDWNLPQPAHKVEEMTQMRFTSRNGAVTFADHTLKNLEYIIKAQDDHGKVHPVTQLANSLLGLVLIPREQGFVTMSKTQKLNELQQQGWPAWEVTKGTCSTLKDLMDNLRVAVAHGDMKYSSDSPHLDKVRITFLKYPKHKKEPDWCARIKAADLHEFCQRFIQLLKNTLD